MELIIVARHIEITDRFRRYVDDKVSKIANLADRPLELHITVSRHHGGKGLVGSDRVELTLIEAGPIVRAESDGEDKYAAFDLALGRLIERLRRAKDRKKIRRGGANQPMSLREASGAAFSQVGVTPATPEEIERVTTGAIPLSEKSAQARAAAQVEAESVAAGEEDDELYTPVIIRKKVFDAPPMSLDDAMYNMELVGHDFYLFVDDETQRPSVVYRRKGWDYGVIGLDMAS
ncbi:MAG: ribosomal subunit interface protein [Alpinimonas sp.]|jgi:ribosomal subunit interface protein